MSRATSLREFVQESLEVATGGRDAMHFRYRGALDVGRSWGRVECFPSGVWVRQNADLLAERLWIIREILREFPNDIRLDEGYAGDAGSGQFVYLRVVDYGDEEDPRDGYDKRVVPFSDEKITAAAERWYYLDRDDREDIFYRIWEDPFYEEFLHTLVAQDMAGIAWRFKEEPMCVLDQEWVKIIDSLEGDTEVLPTLYYLAQMIEEPAGRSSEYLETILKQSGFLENKPAEDGTYTLLIPDKSRELKEIKL